MKVFVLALLALIPAVSHADYRPGRVRATAVATMKVVEATGIYKGIKSVEMAALSQDDRQGYVAFDVKVSGRATRFAVAQAELSECGDTYAANGLETLGMPLVSKLSFKDMSRATCELVVTNLWEKVTIITVDRANPGSASRLVLQGNPEPLMVTM